MSIGAPLLRAVSVLRHIVDREVPPTISELSRALSLPKPTAHRLAAALEKAGLVRKDPLTRRYQVGDAMEALAFGAIRTGVGQGVRRFHMQELSDEVGERVNLGVLSADKEPHVAWVESVSPRGDGPKLDVNPGLRLPLHCTANGKLLLTHAQSAFRRRILDSAPYRAYTNHSVTTASALLAELERIQGQGFAEDREEFLDGVVCLAVPVRDGRGQVVAGLAIMAPVARVSLEGVRSRLPDLRACADSISRELVRPKTAGSDGGNGTTR